MDLAPHTYGFDSMKTLLTEALNENIEIVAAKFGPMIRVKPTEDSKSSKPFPQSSVSTPSPSPRAQ